MAKKTKNTNLKTPAKSLLYNFLQNKVFDDYETRKYREEFLENIKEGNEIENIFDNQEKLQSFLKREYKDKINFEPLQKLVNQYIKQIKGGNFKFRYYQVLAILFSYVVIRYKDLIIKDYIDYIEQEEGIVFEDKYNIEKDINRLNYWMATGSGKTYLMYLMLLMYLKFSKNKTKENNNFLYTEGKQIFILVPSDGLRQQHKNFMENTFENKSFGEENAFSFSNLSGDDTLFEGSLEFNNNIYKITLTTTQKLFQNEGEMIKNTKNAIFIFDEGHKGEAGITDKEGNKEDNKKINLIRKNNFVFDWSATFKTIYQEELEYFSKNKIDKGNIKPFEYYTTTSVFRYDMTIFKSDGFGKLPKTLFVKGDENEAVKINTIVSLIGFAKQVETWNKDFESKKIKGEKNGITFYKPLYLGVAHTKGGAKDIEKGKIDKNAQDNLKGILYYFIDTYKKILEDKNYLQDLKQEFNQLNISDELINGLDNLKELFGEKDKVRFNLVNDTEIIFKIGKYKGLISIGEAKKFLETLKKEFTEKFGDLVLFGDDKLNKGENIFQKLEQDETQDIVYLFGSKKFIEGWDNKRPSTLMIVKGADKSDTTAIQLLGRGLRLEGKNGDGFRHISETTKQEYELEKLYIAGYKTAELENFLKQATGDIKIIKIQKTEYYNKDHEDLVKKYLKKNLLKYPKLKLKDKKIKQNIEYKIETNGQGQNFEIKLNGQNISFNTKFKYNTLNIKNQDGQVEIEYKELYKPNWEIVKNYVKQTLYNFNYENKVLINISDNDLKKIYNEIKLLGVNDDKEDIYGKIKFIQKIFYNLFRKILQKDDEILQETYILNENDILFDYNIEITLNSLDELKDLVGLELKEEYKNEDYFIIDEKGIEKYFIVEAIEKINKEIEELEKSLEAVKSIESAKKVIQKSIKEKKEKLEKQKYTELEKILDNLIDNLVGEKEKKHLYKRLFNLNEVKEELKKDIYNPLNENTNIHFIPTSVFELNNYEKERLEKFIEKLESKFSNEKYDILFYRNQPKNGANLIYEDKFGIKRHFYPDFIFWIFNKENNEEKHILIYYEPKGNEEESDNKARTLKMINNKYGKGFEYIFSGFHQERIKTEENLDLGDNFIYLGILDKI